MGLSFAADVLRRERQCVLVVRETLTSFTLTRIIDDEQSVTLRDGLVQLLAALVPLNGPLSTVRCDPGPGFIGLSNDPLLRDLRIVIEIGRPKNKNKNPVAERAIQEVEAEIVRIQPDGGPVSAVTLATLTARLNSRIRENGLASRELLYQRDQFTGDPIAPSDVWAGNEQLRRRLSNHTHSAQSKCPRGQPSSHPTIVVGDIVYVSSDKDKTRARSRYLVTAVDGIWCNIRKFTSTQLRSASYKVKLSDCIKVRSEIPYVSPDRTAEPEEGDDAEVFDDAGDPCSDEPTAADILDVIVPRAKDTISLTGQLPPMAIPPEISEPLLPDPQVYPTPVASDTLDDQFVLDPVRMPETRTSSRNRKVPNWHKLYDMS